MSAICQVASNHRIMTMKYRMTSVQVYIWNTKWQNGQVQYKPNENCVWDINRKVYFTNS